MMLLSSKGIVEHEIDLLPERLQVSIINRRRGGRKKSIHLAAVALASPVIMAQIDDRFFSTTVGRHG